MAREHFESEEGEMSPRASYDPATMVDPILICNRCGAADAADRFLQSSKSGTRKRELEAIFSLECPTCHTMLDEYRYNITAALGILPTEDLTNVSNAQVFISEVQDKVTNVNTDAELEEIQKQLQQAFDTLEKIQQNR